jgi:hypothetical protein
MNLPSRGNKLTIIAEDTRNKISMENFRILLFLKDFTGIDDRD